MAILLDLRKDFAEIYTYVIERVRSFDPMTNAGPGTPGPVAYMEFGYAFEQSAWVALVFDTRPDASPDGVWTFYIVENRLKRPLWQAAFDSEEGAWARIIELDGTERYLPLNNLNEYAALFGEMLEAVLVKARAEGLFANLPKAARCEMGVEEENGRYGWPRYEDRGKENLA